jgi:branched-chain amino acid transport system permease protein
VERVFLRRTYGRPESIQLLVTFALFVILEDLQKLTFGVHARYHDTPLQLLGVTVVGEIAFLNYKLLMIVPAVFVMVALRWALRNTRIGKLTGAVVADREMAQALGVNTHQVFAIAFTFGVFVAALGGAIASPTFAVAPGLAAEALVLGFAVAAIGGLGQIEGAAVAAVIIGLGRAGAIYFVPVLDAVVPYLVMVVVLLLRPHGLFGAPQARRI